MASRLMAAVALVLSIPFQSTAYVRDLASAPADIRWRHSGRQGGAETPEYYGREMATGDFNGDGRTDLVVAADHDTAGIDYSYGRGFVYVYFGRGDEFPTLLDPAEREADCRIYGEAPFGYFGTELAVGDFDGDGVDDLAVSQIELTTVYKGAVFLFSGPAITANPEVRVDRGEYMARLSGRPTGTPYQGHYLYFGFALAAADFNDDGVSDLAVAAFGGYGLDRERRHSGDVHLFLGRRSGWPREAVATKETADLFILGRTENLDFGTELGAGDVDGDGRPELFVAAYDGAGPDGARPRAGDVSVFAFDRSSPFQLPARPGTAPAALFWDTATTPPAAVVYGPRGGARIGSSASDGGGRTIAVGDVDGDGLYDLVLGSPFYGEVAQNSKNPGAIYVVWGHADLTKGAEVDLAAADGASPAARLLAVGGPGDSLGDTVRLADLNGDGRAEVVAGAPDADAATGYVAVFAGRTRADLPAAGPLAGPDAVVRGPRAGWRAGDDAVVLDASFAGQAILALGVPFGGYVPPVGRGYAGEVDGIFTAPLAEALPPEPSIAAGGAVAVAPNGRGTLEVRATPAVGSIASLEGRDLPSFASIRTVDAGAGLYELALRPSAADRGVYTVTLVATDEGGRTATRRVRVTVGYAPTITSVKLKMISLTVYRLTVVGTGFAAGEAIVTVDGVGMGPVKYPAAFAEGDGATVRRVTVTNSRLPIVVQPGRFASVRVLNPRERLVSNAGSVTR